jgi:hypothetical protein
MITKKASGYLFIVAGVAFLAAAIIEDKMSYYGLAAMFVIIGVTTILKSK